MANVLLYIGGSMHGRYSTPDVYGDSTRVLVGVAPNTEVYDLREIEVDGVRQRLMVLESLSDEQVLSKLSSPRT